MNRVIVSGLALLTAASLAACQQAPASDKAAEELKAEKEKTAALEQRIADLETRAAAVPAPGMTVPAPTTNWQAPAAAPEPAPVRKTVRRAAAPKKTSTSSRVAVIDEPRAAEPAEKTCGRGTNRLPGNSITKCRLQSFRHAWLILWISGK